MAKPTSGSLQSRGSSALALYEAHADVLAPRLPAGFRDTFVAALTAIGVVVPAAKVLREAAKGASLTEDQAADLLLARVGAARLQIDAEPTIKAASRKAWGMSIRMNRRVNKSLIAGGTALLDQAAAAPAEKAAAGILDVDLDAIRAAIAVLQGADRAQEASKRRSKSATASRNSTLKAVELGIKKIRAAGLAQFVSASPEVRASFEAL